MFGDSVEDSRASQAALANTPPGVNMFFCPVIPGDEKKSFETGSFIIKEAMDGNILKSRAAAEKLEEEFTGREAGSRWNTL